MYTAQTFAPRPWPVPKPVSQTEYSKRFAAEFPEVASILPMRNVVVAGGAAAWPLGEPSRKAGDVDLFIHGIDPTDKATLWKKLDEVVNRVTKAFVAAGERRTMVSQTMTAPGVVTLIVWRFANNSYGRYGRDAKMFKVQVILRAYRSVSSILHAFDVPSAAVAYDGKEAYTTALGAYAHTFRANLVNPAYRSTTYEARLAKYFERGFALVLPRLRLGSLVRDQALVLPHLRLRPYVVRGRLATGELILPPEALAAGSDYTPTDGPRGMPEKNLYGAWRYNAKQLVGIGGAPGPRRFMLTGVGGIRLQRQGREYDRQLRFARFAEKEPGLADVLPREKLRDALDDSLSGAYKDKKVNLEVMRRMLQMTPEEITRLTLAVTRLQSENPGRALDLRAALTPFKNRVLAAYDATPTEITWWIVHEPGRQFTASVNPRMEDPAAWYGEAYDAAPAPPTSEEYIAALQATLESWQGAIASGKAIYDGACALCLEPVTRGDANSVTLACGHVYHWSQAPNCEGLIIWIGAGNNDCPTCRRAFDKEERDGERDDEPIVVPPLFEEPAQVPAPAPAPAPAPVPSHTIHGDPDLLATLLGGVSSQEGDDSEHDIPD
jgi:hypothetical protein